VFTKRKSIIGLYTDENSVADAMDGLKSKGFGENEYEVLTGVPYPEGTFGEAEPHLHLHKFPLIGAVFGFCLGLVFTIGTQIAFPVVTGGKPILAIPAMAIIMYELTLLGAILFTVGGIIFESRLPKLFMGAYDPRITEGFIGVVVNTTEDNLDNAQDVFKSSGAEDIKFP
tara:strand:- start:1855 stop:2367 length:513 start_codon:yes stop_codon:yes gene_type:complete